MKHWLRQRLNTTLFAWVEAVLLTLLVLLACFYMHPVDPYFFHGPFPWPWFAGVLIGLRYGIGPAILSLGLVIASIYFTGEHHKIDAQSLQMYYLSGFILTLFCSEFNANWLNRIRRAEHLNDYANERLDNLSRSYYLLRLSHDRMEQDLITKPITFRSVIVDLRSLLLKNRGELTASSAERLLHLLMQSCSFDQAALFLSYHDMIDTTPLAFIGEKTLLNKSDPLVIQSLASHETCYHSIAELEEYPNNQYLIAAPMRTSEGKLIGLLVVEKMSFWALTEKTLKSLSIFLAYFADDIWAHQQGLTILERYPNCPPEFAAELYRMTQLKDFFNIESALTAFFIEPSPRQHNIVSDLMHNQRGLDFSWHTTVDEYAVLFTLMPFAGPTAVAGYIARIRQWLQTTFHINLEEEECQVRYQQISKSNPLELLNTILVQHSQDEIT